MTKMVRNGGKTEFSSHAFSIAWIQCNLLVASSLIDLKPTRIFVLMRDPGLKSMSRTNLERKTNFLYDLSRTASERVALGYISADKHLTKSNQESFFLSGRRSGGRHCIILLFHRSSVILAICPAQIHFSEATLSIKHRFAVGFPRFSFCLRVKFQWTFVLLSICSLMLWLSWEFLFMSWLAVHPRVVVPVGLCALHC